MHACMQIRYYTYGFIASYIFIAFPTMSPMNTGGWVGGWVGGESQATGKVLGMSGLVFGMPGLGRVSLIHI